MGGILIASGRPEEGIAATDRALQLSPKDLRLHLYLNVKSSDLFASGRFEEAAKLSREVLARRPDDNMARVLLVAILALAGIVDEARANIGDSKRLTSILNE